MVLWDQFVHPHPDGGPGQQRREHVVLGLRHPAPHSADGAANMADGRLVTKAALIPSPGGAPIRARQKGCRSRSRTQGPGRKRQHCSCRNPPADHRRPSAGSPDQPTEHHLAEAIGSPRRLRRKIGGGRVRRGPPRLVFAPPVPTVQERFRPYGPANVDHAAYFCGLNGHISAWRQAACSTNGGCSLGGQWSVAGCCWRWSASKMVYGTRSSNASAA